MMSCHAHRVPRMRMQRSRPVAKFFNSLTEPDHRLLPQGSKEARKTADASGKQFCPNISKKIPESACW
jgi:hypothetical protein